MQILIDIPEDTYNHLRNGGSIGASLMIENAIKNGKPLPKGHGRLGDLDALNNGLRGQQKSYEYTSGIRRPINEAVKDGIIIARTHIDCAPTIIDADKESEENK